MPEEVLLTTAKPALQRLIRSVRFVPTKDGSGLTFYNVPEAAYVVNMLVSRLGVEKMTAVAGKEVRFELLYCLAAMGRADEFEALLSTSPEEVDYTPLWLAVALTGLSHCVSYLAQVTQKTSYAHRHVQG